MELKGAITNFHPKNLNTAFNMFSGVARIRMTKPRSVIVVFVAVLLLFGSFVTGQQNNNKNNNNNANKDAIRGKQLTQFYGSSRPRYDTRAGTTGTS